MTVRALEVWLSPSLSPGFFLVPNVVGNGGRRLNALKRTAAVFAPAERWTRHRQKYSFTYCYTTV